MPNPKYISLQEASKGTPYSQEYLSLLARKGKLFSVKLGRNWYTTREAVDDYLKKQSVVITVPKNLLKEKQASYLFHDREINTMPLNSFPVATLAQTLTPEEPEEGEKPTGHKKHSKVFEEFEKLNPQVFGQQKPSSILRQKETGQLPPSPPPSQPPPLISPSILETLTGEHLKTEESVLTKLDKLSNALGGFAEKITTQISELPEQPRIVSGGLSEQEREFIQVESNSLGHRFRKFNGHANSMMRSPVRMFAVMISAIVMLFILAGGFSFGQVDYVVQQVKKVFKDADTIQGHFVGTHANEVLVLDKAGNISIFGHIETQGQLRSYAPNGVAPIVVDSVTKVENLNADYFDDLDSKDFTLAFVTKNGNITYEDVFLEGNVEVGKTLTVKGAVKLLDSLQVYGALGIFSEATFGKNVTLTGGNLVLEKGTIQISNTNLIKNLNAEFLDGVKKGDINLQFVTDNGSTTANPITVGGLTVNGQSDFYAPGFFYKGVWGSDGAFGTLGAATAFTLGNQDDPSDATFEVYAKKFKVDNVGNVTASGRVSSSELSTSNIVSDLIPSGSYNLGKASSPWQSLFIVNVTASGSINFSGVTSSSFVINSNNTSSDSEDAYLAFERGVITPNARLLWNSTDKRFEFNEPLVVASASFTAWGNINLGSASSDTLTIYTSTASIPNNLNFDSGSLFIDSTNNRVGILTTSPSTTFEVQGTASASYLLTGNTIQVGGFSSVSYNRFGTLTTGHSNYISASNDLHISGDLEVRGTASFGGGASISGNFNLAGDQTISGNLTVNGTGSSSFAGSVDITKGLRAAEADFNNILVTTSGGGLTFNGGGTNIISSTGTLQINAFTLGGAITGNSQSITGVNHLSSTTASISANFQTAGRFIFGDNGDTGEINTSDWDISSTGAMTGFSFDANGTGNSISNIDNADLTADTLDFTAISDSPTLDANLNISRAGFFIGLGAAPSTVFEVQGTASASYLLTGNTLQVGGFSSVSYNRFGTLTTGHSNYISASNDLHISGDLEVRGTASFGGGASISGNFNLAGDQTISGNLTVNGTGSSSFAGSVDITKGLRAAEADFNNILVTTSGGGLTFNGGGTNIISSTGTLQINAFTLGGAITGNSQSITGVNHLSSTTASISANFQTSGRFIFGDNGDTGEINTSDWDISSTGAMTGFSFDANGTGNSISNIDNADLTADTLDFTAISDNPTLDANLNISRSGFYIGLGAAPSTVFEVQGTASASYLLTGNTLQVGGFASAAYNRFGTGTSSELHYITGSSDLFITGDLEVDGSVSFAGPASISNTLYVSTLGKTGNVGIGTTGPGAGLHVADPSSGPVAIFDTDTNTQNFYVTRLGDTDQALSIGVDDASVYLESIQDENTAGYGNMIFRVDDDTTADGYFAFQTKAGTEYMRIIDGGNVGIGTTGPVALLDLEPASTYAGPLFRVASGSNERLRVTSGGNVGIGITPGTGSSGTGTLGITPYGSLSSRVGFDGTGNNALYLSNNVKGVWKFNAASLSAFQMVMNGAAATTWDFNVADGTGKSAGDTITFTTAMSIKDNGNVGIGTTAPIALLDLEPASTYTGPLFRVASGSNERLRVTSGGNVGIGTTGPGALLDVYSTGAAFPATSGSTQSAGLRARLGRDDGAVLDVGSNGASGLWLQATNGTNLATNYSLLLNPNAGNVGIGTTGPVSDLQIGSTANDTATKTLRITTQSYGLLVTAGKNANQIIQSIGSTGYLEFQSGNSNDQKYVFSGTGNVGIGTTAPIALLDLEPASTYAGDLFRIASGSTEVITVKSNGNVGIGTTAPIAPLHVESSHTFPSLRLNNQTAGGEAGIRFKSYEGANAMHADIFADATGSETGRIGIRVPYTSEVVSILNGGNVGIGTTAPVRELHVGAGGDATFQTYTGITVNVDNVAQVSARNGLNNVEIGMFAHTDVGYLGTWTNHELRLRTNNADVMTLLESGSVGIGTTSPISRMDVLSTAASDGISLRNSSALGTASGGIVLGFTTLTPNAADQRLGLLGFGGVETGTTNAAGAGVSGWSGAAWGSGDTPGYLRFETTPDATSGRLERMRIDMNGNVGIGTTGPSAVLTVYEPDESTTLTNFTQAVGNAGLLISTNYTASAYTPGIFWNTTDNNATKPKGGIWLLEDGSGTDMYFGTSNLYTTGITNNGLVLDQTGNVGIGTTAPIALLDLEPASTYAGPLFRVASGSNERLRVTSGGNVGIGTTSPDSLLELSSTATNFIIRSTGSTSSASIDFQPAGGASSSNQGKFTIRAGGLGGTRERLDIINADNTKLFTIASAGNVGIGTTAPNLGGYSADSRVATILTGSAANSVGVLELGSGIADADDTRYGDLAYVHGNTTDTAKRLAIIRGSTDGTTANNRGGQLKFFVQNDGVNTFTQAMTIRQSGNVGIGTTDPGSIRLNVVANAAVYGLQVFNDGNSATYRGMTIQAGADDAAGTNTAVDIYDGDGTLQGAITFSGGTVTYGAFTANHDGRVPEKYNKNGYEYGTLLCTKSIILNEDQPRGISYDMEACDTPYASNVLGAYAGKYEQEENKHQVYILGDGHILVNNEGGDIKVGDLITTSSVEGIGMKANKYGLTIGIAQENYTFSSPSETKLIVVQYGARYYAPNLENLLADTASSSSGVVVTSGGVVSISSLQVGMDSVISGTADILGTLADAVMVRVQSLWATGDIIAEGIKKTYYSVALAFDWEFGLGVMALGWLSREITLAPNVDLETTSLFSGSGAQAAGQSKVDLVSENNGAYLATYGVDSTRGEIYLSGSSEISGGEAKIFFDFSFTSVISGAVPLKVILTPTTNMQGQLYVANKTPYGFVVKSINGPGNGTFDWLAIARRRGYEGADMTSNQLPVTSDQNDQLPVISPTPLAEPVLTSSPTEPAPASSSQPVTDSNQLLVTSDQNSQLPVIASSSESTPEPTLTVDESLNNIASASN